MQRLIELAVETVPRVFGLTDRNAASRTAGCCDRSYWHYRITDVPNGRFQEAGLLFALAYATPHPANPFAGRERVAEWARLTWQFWLRQRNTDGSIAEVYPNERSFCATAFTAAAFAETIDLLGGPEAWQSELAAARSTFAWLGDNANADVSNQMVASWLGLAGYARHTGDAGIAALAAQRRERVLASQLPDGTFPEYGGLDGGYQTVTLSTLARLKRIQPDDGDLAATLDRGVAPLDTLISPLGTMDPAANSRGTQYLYPAGLAALGSPLLDRLLAGVEANTLLRPGWLDDRYCHTLAADYFLAGRS